MLRPSVNFIGEIPSPFAQNPQNALTGDTQGGIQNEDWQTLRMKMRIAAGFAEYINTSMSAMLSGQYSIRALLGRHPNFFSQICGLHCAWFSFSLI